MAYDWTGNEVRQKHYDRVIVAAVLAVISVVVTVPFMVRYEGPATTKGLVEDKAPVARVEPQPIQIARS